VSQWVSPSEFQRLDPVANAGQFGDEGRHSVDKNFAITEKAKLQFRTGGLQCDKPRQSDSAPIRS
jgi:hypothetical protein